MNNNIKTIALSGTTLEYEIRRHVRARRTSLTLYPDGRMVVTLTPVTHERNAERILKKNQSWILKNLKKMENENKIFLPKVSKSDVKQIKEETKTLVDGRLQYFNVFYRLGYNRVTIKDHKKQWGSCSPKRNLNFNLRLIFLPDLVRDLVIVHELCHLKEMNHSKKFWNLVEQTIPQYSEMEKELKRHVIT